MRALIDREAQKARAEHEDKYHIIATVDGNLYTEWQVRVSGMRLHRE